MEEGMIALSLEGWVWSLALFSILIGSKLFFVSGTKAAKKESFRALIVVSWMLTSGVAFVLYFTLLSQNYQG